MKTPNVRTSVSSLFKFRLLKHCHPLSVHDIKLRCLLADATPQTLGYGKGEDAYRLPNMAKEIYSTTFDQYSTRPE